MQNLKNEGGINAQDSRNIKNLYIKNETSYNEIDLNDMNARLLNENVLKKHGMKNSRAFIELFKKPSEKNNDVEVNANVFECVCPPHYKGI